MGERRTYVTLRLLNLGGGCPVLRALEVLRVEGRRLVLNGSKTSRLGDGAGSAHVELSARGGSFASRCSSLTNLGVAGLQVFVARADPPLSPAPTTNG